MLTFKYKIHTIDNKFSQMFNIWENMSAYLCRIGDNMHKKIKLGLFVFIIIGVVILNFTYKNKNEVTKNKQRKQNNLAIMIKN